MRWSEILSLLDLDDSMWNDKGEAIIELTYPLVSWM